MLARFVQKGESIDYRPDTPVAAGDVVVQDNLVGIARLDIPAGTLGSLAVVGVFDVEKDSSAVAAGNAVYWDADAKKATTAKTGNRYLGKATTAKTGNRYLGKAILDADASGETVRVLLNAVSDFVASIASAAAIADLTDNSGGTASDVVPVSDAGSRDAVASLAAKVNAILSALRAANIISE